MDTTAAAQQPCTLCAKRLQGHRAFGLFTAQLQRIRSTGDAASGSSVRDSSRTGKRPLAALQRAQLYPAAKSRSKYVGLQPETPKRVREGPAWRLSATADQSQAGQTASADQPPPGCSRYTVELRKPLGLVLEEDRHGSIFVAEVSEGGNAAKSGLISKGDQLIATSGYVFERETKYQDVYVRSGERVVRLNTRGEDFSVIMAAIRSHPSQREVKLELQRCEM